MGETAAIRPTLWEAQPDPLLLGACEVKSAVTMSHFVHFLFIYCMCISLGKLGHFFYPICLVCTQLGSYPSPLSRKGITCYTYGGRGGRFIICFYFSWLCSVFLSLFSFFLRLFLLIIFICSVFFVFASSSFSSSVLSSFFLPASFCLPLPFWAILSSLSPVCFHSLSFSFASLLSFSFSSFSLFFL